MSKNTNKPSERHYLRWQLAKGSSITSVVRGIDEDETRICWVGEDDYLRLKEDYDAADRATFDAIRTITQLRDENERLRKAGSALALLQSPTDYSPEQVKLQCVLDWVNATEGRDAK